jgi:hypothetical protein
LRWGVYVVLKAPNDYARACFKEYGLKTDPGGWYAAMYKPYHLIGLELGMSVLSAALRGEPTGQPRDFRGDVVAVAKRQLRAGETLDGEGGYTVWGKLVLAQRSLAEGALPIGLAHKVPLLRDVAAERISRSRCNPEGVAAIGMSSIEKVNASGRGAIGTPDDALRVLENYWTKTGGFGCVLMLAHDWADWEATKRSYELFARYVLPRFEERACGARNQWIGCARIAKRSAPNARPPQPVPSSATSQPTKQETTGKPRNSPNQHPSRRWFTRNRPGCRRRIRVDPVSRLQTAVRGLVNDPVVRSPSAHYRLS